mmetsp:Transcript_10651/g.21176  ORF Transcript_10651/g.21176 Transcript_10651/m.21176 type:complete len:243 (-) Transcript_10651:38-766(-)
MFGDTFGTKSDYTKGMEYSMRNGYMGSEAGQVSSLPPDTMFMSREQARKLVSAPDLEGHENLDNVLSFNSPTKKKKKMKKRGRGRGRDSRFGVKRVSAHFNASDSDSDSDASPSPTNPVGALLAARMATSPKSKSQMLKDNAAKNKARIAREKAKSPSLDEAWVHVEQAGCKFYVNRFTGEATTEDPFCLSPKKFHELHTAQPRLPPPGDAIATGCTVYEGELREEFEKVMAFLEGTSKTYE